MTRAHKRYECEECDKRFKFETILEKHVEAVHEDVKLYCHYFNNKKESPHGDEECLYLHEESVVCKFGLGCERTMCMFVHDGVNNDQDSEDDSSDDESEIDDDIKWFNNAQQSQT